jgi:hypothetical protein
LRFAVTAIPGEGVSPGLPAGARDDGRTSVAADDATAPGPAAAGIDTTVSHSARIWNYWLGGTDNYPVDRQAGDKVAEMLPIIVVQARADRAFLGRAIRHLAGREGIRQFLDIGSGLPTADNTHEVAQRAAAESRIVYADNDPLVLMQARALLAGTPEGRRAAATTSTATCVIPARSSPMPRGPWT